MKIKGFTLIEVMIVIVIVGVLAILFIPNMQDPIERSRSKTAAFALQAIYSAEKRYLLSERSYYTSNDTGSINKNLFLNLNNTYFSYNIKPSGNGYLATAVRIDGKCKGLNMTVTHDNSTVKKTGCTAW
jgi:prepilin-type N-terminal cleavage/methylation domain-containing protein